MQDLEDTTGSWELYGQEDEKRYPALQAEFFDRAAAPLTRRESIISFTAVSAPLSTDMVVSLAAARLAMSRQRKMAKEILAPAFPVLLLA